MILSCAGGAGVPKVLCVFLLSKIPLGITDGGQISLPRSVREKGEPCGAFLAKIMLGIK